jgi:hypothetical protein
MSGQVTDSAAAAFQAFTQTGILTPGDWFYAPRGWPLPIGADSVSEWNLPIDHPGSPWKPVGGPKVGARLKCTPYWCELIFDQESHPFGRFDLDDLSVAYQAADDRLVRVYAPNPHPLNRVTLTLTPDLGDGAIQIFVPGVIDT